MRFKSVTSVWCSIQSTSHIFWAENLAVFISHFPCYFTLQPQIIHQGFIIILCNSPVLAMQLNGLYYIKNHYWPVLDCFLFCVDKSKQFDQFWGFETAGVKNHNNQCTFVFLQNVYYLKKMKTKALSCSWTFRQNLLRGLSSEILFSHIS